MLNFSNQEIKFTFGFKLRTLVNDIWGWDNVMRLKKMTLKNQKTEEKLRGEATAEERKENMIRNACERQCVEN